MIYILKVFLEGNRILAETSNVKAIIPGKVSSQIGRILIWDWTKPTRSIFSIPHAVHVIKRMLYNELVKRFLMKTCKSGKTSEMKNDATAFWWKCN